MIRIHITKLFYIMCDINEKYSMSLSPHQSQIHLLHAYFTVERVQYLFTFPVYIR